MARCIECDKEIGFYETANKGRCYTCSMEVLSEKLGFDPRHGDREDGKEVAVIKDENHVDMAEVDGRERNDFHAGVAVGFALRAAMAVSESLDREPQMRLINP
ncbi:hypothetical protein BXY66_1432 [Shimia isoporae]|uniref:Uncharacterized protein n=1 Tax=Shimia isoporae TaxID=647720 RepID=A0A4R1NLX1_9RHOB|nr:hypothetical protein [Shimia isoporae]TCL09387.1 hypothetical protein BXY66_1432 [Shimia isoporae]